MNSDDILKMAQKFCVLAHGPDHDDYLDELDYMDESELMLEKQQLERQVQESLADEQEIPPMVQDKIKEVLKRLRKKESCAKIAAEYQGKKSS